MDLEFLESIRSFELNKVLAIISKAKMDRNNIVILEIGAGAGWQAKKLTENGYEVEAIDVEESNYSENRVWAVTDYDGKNIPFLDDYFDIVFSSSVLEHIPHLEEFHAEMQRVLKPDGIAIHIVPGAVWRFWTNMAHYPYVVITAMKVIYNRLASKHKVNNANDMDFPAEISLMQSIKNIIFPHRHGETGNALTEIYYFRRHRWSVIFQEGGWRIIKVIPNGLLYTGYLVFGALLSIDVRRFMSSFLGSSCYIFVLTKAKADLYD